MAPTKSYLFDTCIVIDYLRGKNLHARQWFKDVFDGDISAGISVLTDFELWIGVRSPKEAKEHKMLLARLRRYQFHVTIARRAGEIFRLLKEQGMRPDPMDTLIAATAEYYQVDIVTANIKHFSHFPLDKITIIPIDSLPQIPQPAEP